MNEIIKDIKVLREHSTVLLLVEVFNGVKIKEHKSSKLYYKDDVLLVEIKNIKTIIVRHQIIRHLTSLFDEDLPYIESYPLIK